MKSDIKEIWNKSEWTVQARQIVNALKDFPNDSKTIIILRHSHRENTNDIEKMTRLGLTSQGKKIAEIFGNNIPEKYFIRLFFSVVPRCMKTAECILRGFKKKKGGGIIMGAYKPLYDLKSKKNYVTEQAFKYPGPRFIDQWAAGLFPYDSIIPFINYCQDAAKKIWNKIEKKSSNKIDIHITHDLMILGLRLGWFGISPYKNWVDYLSGFAFSFQEDQILLYNNGKFSSVEIPYWYDYKL